VPAAAAAAASRGAPARSARLERFPIALTDAGRHGLTRPGEPRLLSDRVMRGFERDDISSNRHPALTLCWRMILSENRFTLFGLMR